MPEIAVAAAVAAELVVVGVVEPSADSWAL